MKKCLIVLLIIFSSVEISLNLRIQEVILKQLSEDEGEKKNITRGQLVVTEGLLHLGKYNYSFGGGNYEGPTKGKYKPEINHCDDRARVGFDCGGFVLYVYYKALNLKLPHGPSVVYKKAKKENKLLPLSERQPGDLVFYKTNKKDAPYPYRHIAIYAGNNTIVQSEGHEKGSCKPKLISHDEMSTKDLAEEVARFW